MKSYTKFNLLSCLCISLLFFASCKKAELPTSFTLEGPNPMALLELGKGDDEPIKAGQPYDLVVTVHDSSSKAGITNATVRVNSDDSDIVNGNLSGSTDSAGVAVLSNIAIGEFERQKDSTVITLNVKVTFEGESAINDFEGAETYLIEPSVPDKEQSAVTFLDDNDGMVYGPTTDRETKILFTVADEFGNAHDLNSLPSDEIEFAAYNNDGNKINGLTFGPVSYEEYESGSGYQSPFPDAELSPGTVEIRASTTTQNWYVGNTVEVVGKPDEINISVSPQDHVMGENFGKVFADLLDKNGHRSFGYNGDVEVLLLGPYSSDTPENKVSLGSFEATNGRFEYNPDEYPDQLDQAGDYKIELQISFEDGSTEVSSKTQIFTVTNSEGG